MPSTRPYAPPSPGDERPDNRDDQASTPHPRCLAAGEDLGTQLEAGQHPGHLSTVTMMGATADHFVEASEAAGIDVDLPRAVQAHYTWARSRGHGGENWSRIIDAIRPYV